MISLRERGERVLQLAQTHWVKLVITVIMVVLAGSNLLLWSGLREARDHAEDAYTLADQHGVEIETLEQKIETSAPEDMSGRLMDIENSISDLEANRDATNRYVSRQLSDLDYRVSDLERQGRYRY